MRSSDWESQIFEKKQNKTKQNKKTKNKNKQKTKKIEDWNLGSTRLNQVQYEGFGQFIEFGSKVFFEIAYNDA